MYLQIVDIVVLPIPTTVWLGLPTVKGLAAVHLFAFLANKFRHYVTGGVLLLTLPR